jgi:hypothetical protein
MEALDGSNPAEESITSPEIPELDGTGLARILKVVVEISRRSHRHSPCIVIRGLFNGLYGR